MRTYFILVCLLSFCGLSLECKHNLVLDMEFTGQKIAQYYAPDAGYCQHLCTQHATCQFFSFIRADWTINNRNFHCTLMSSSTGQPSKQAAKKGLTSGYSLKSCKPDPQPCVPFIYDGLDFLGGDYRSLFTADYEQCQRACTRDHGCHFFTYVKSNYKDPKYRYKCHLKFGWTQPKINMVKIPTSTSGFSQRVQSVQYFDTVCKSTLFEDTDIPYNSLEVFSAASPEHCQMYCSAHPHCDYFTYIRSNFQCHLKKNTIYMPNKYVKGYTSGVPQRHCQLDNIWVRRMYAGVDFQHNNMHDFITNNAEECRRACTEDTNCQFYTYVEKSKDPAFRKRCFFKRVITLPIPPKITKLDTLVSGFSLKNCCYKMVA